MSTIAISTTEVACATEENPMGCVEIRSCEHCGNAVCMDHDDVTFCGWSDEYVHEGCEADCEHCHTWGRISAYPRE